MILQSSLSIPGSVDDLTWDDVKKKTDTFVEYVSCGKNMTWDDVKRMIRDMGGTLSYENFMLYRHLYNSTIPLPNVPPPRPEPEVIVKVPQKIYDMVNSRHDI